VGRVELSYEVGSVAQPASVVVKLAAARDDRSYERCVREVRFYRELDVAFAPRLYYGAADDDLRRVVLVLEDVGAGRQGDVLHGCSVDDAALVLETLAPLHARWWGERASTSGFPRFGRNLRARQTRYAGRVDRFLEEHGTDLPSAVCSVVELLRSRFVAVAGALDARAQTLIHADLHLDNLIFDPGGNRRSVVVLDWQTVSVGPPAWDVARFLFDSLSVEDRRSAEAELLDRYVAVLVAHGVRGYSVEDLRLECELALLVFLAGIVGWLTTVDRCEVTSREAALQRAALADGRLVTALVDHDVESLFGRDEL
jgi:Phosphotransferase enzyme family